MTPPSMAVTSTDVGMTSQTIGVVRNHLIINRM
jgi:hypothetical protein